MRFRKKWGKDKKRFLGGSKDRCGKVRIGVEEGQDRKFAYVNLIFQEGENENNYDDDDMANEWGMVGYLQSRSNVRGVGLRRFKAIEVNQGGQGGQGCQGIHSD
jgi:hypothetical protein